MFRTTLMAITILFAGTGVVRAAPERYVYELRVGGKSFDVTLGERFELALPGGRPFAILRHTPTSWAGHGIRFTHPGDMKVRATNHRPLTGIDQVGIGVRRDDSVTVMMALRPRGERQTVRESLAEGVEGLRLLAKHRHDADMKETPWREKVADVERKGVRLTATKGEDPLCAGLLAFPFVGRTLVIGFQAPRSRSEEALAAFREVATSLAVAEEEEKPEPAGGLELKIGDRTYPVQVQRGFLIEGPGGKEFKATLRRGEKTYAGSGIEFEYPGDMTTRTEPKTKRVMIHVEHGDAYFAMLQLFLVPELPPEQVRSTSVEYVRRSVERTGARFGPEKTCRQSFLGKTRTGTLLVTEGGDDPYRIEVYGFEIGKRTIAVLFLCRESNREPAKVAFKKIAKSLSETD